MAVVFKRCLALSVAFITVLAVALLHSCNSFQSDNQIIELEQLNAQLWRFEQESGSLTNQEASREYTRIFSKYRPFKVSSLSAPELKEFFKGVHTISFYTGDREHAKLLLSIVKELNSRDYNNLSPMVLYVEEALIKARMFGALKQFEQDFHGFKLKENVSFKDSIKSKNGKTFIDLDGATLERKEFKHGEVDIIVVSHPRCHFSNNARVYIQNDKFLGDIFSKHSTWLIPQSGNLYTKDVEAAKEEISFKYFYKMSEWPEINHWGTPSFYFYKNGVLAFSFTGWPDEGNRPKLMQGLHSIGL